jgi:hypothetical protein
MRYRPSEPEESALNDDCIAYVLCNDGAELASQLVGISAVEAELFSSVAVQSQR